MRRCSQIKQNKRARPCQDCTGNRIRPPRQARCVLAHPRCPAALHLAPAGGTTPCPRRVLLSLVRIYAATPCINTAVSTSRLTEWRSLQRVPVPLKSPSWHQRITRPPARFRSPYSTCTARTKLNRLARECQRQRQRRPTTATAHSVCSRVFAGRKSDNECGMRATRCKTVRLGKGWPPHGTRAATPSTRHVPDPYC